ncbi:MAG: hypothetical protein D8M54_18185 [Chloroflexi bacterium]|nr:hypothetical protein [Chloroflexota bacterium]
MRIFQFQIRNPQLASFISSPIGDFVGIIGKREQQGITGAYSRTIMKWLTSTMWVMSLPVLGLLFCFLDRGIAYWVYSKIF